MVLDIWLVKSSIGTFGSFVKEDGIGSGSYVIKALPRDSNMVNFTLLEGTDVKSSDNGIIINKALWDEEKWIEPGMTFTMELGGQSTDVTIVGIVNEIPPLPGIYMNLDDYEKIIHDGSRQNIMNSTMKQTSEAELGISRKIEENLSDFHMERQLFRADIPALRSQQHVVGDRCPDMVCYFNCCFLHIGSCTGIQNRKITLE